MTEKGKSIIDQLIKKLGLSGEDRLKEKTTELLRLLKVKSSAGCTINESAKIIICIDLSTKLLGISFDSEIGLKLSGLRKTAYENNKRTFEKLLELNRPVGINDICVQLNLNEFQKKATRYLEIYQNSLNDCGNEVDITHPQYATMAIFQACKSEKGMKSIRTKLMTYSHLKPVQWNKLEQQWNKLLEDHLRTGAKSKQPDKKEDTEIKVSLGTIKKHKIEPEQEDYETWKKRMLEFAFAKLREREIRKSQ